MRIRNIFLEFTPIILGLYGNVLLTGQCGAHKPDSKWMTPNLLTSQQENYGASNIDRHSVLPKDLDAFQPNYNKNITICKDDVYEIGSVYGLETNNSVRIDFTFEISTLDGTTPDETVKRHVGPSLHELFSKSFFQDDPLCNYTLVECVDRQMISRRSLDYKSKVPNIAGIDAVDFKYAADYSTDECKEPLRTCKIMIIPLQVYVFNPKIDVIAASLDRINHGIDLSWYLCAYASIANTDSYNSDMFISPYIPPNSTIPPPVPKTAVGTSEINSKDIDLSLIIGVVAFFCIVSMLAFAAMRRSN